MNFSMLKKNKAKKKKKWKKQMKENFTRELESINFIVQKTENLQNSLELLISRGILKMLIQLCVSYKTLWPTV